MNEPLRLVDNEPPSLANIEAEAALLGALMLDNRLVAVAADRLSVDDFAEPLHGRIFRAIIRLTERGIGANPVTLRPHFEGDAGMRELGGPSYLAGLTGSGAGLIGAQGFIEQVAELSASRKVRDALIGGIESINSDPDQPLVDMLTSLETELWTAAAATDTVRPNSAAGMVNKVLERNERIVTGGRPEGASCRFVPDIDKIVGNAEPGTYNIIAARPGQGKSTLAQSMGLGYAANGHAVEYFHAEMTEEQMAMRVTADLLHALRQPIAHKRLKEGNFDSAEIQWINRASAVAETLPISFNAVKRCDVRRIDAMIARAKLKWARRGKKLEVAFVDYLQLLLATNGGKLIQDKTARVSAVSGALLDIAQKHGIALFALAQLGRAVEDRKDHLPQLNDLKDSGEIEQDADSVTFIKREEYYLLREQPKKSEPNYEKLRSNWELDFDIARGKADLIGAKNRHDQTLTRTVKFYGANYAMRGSDYSEHSYVDEPLMDFGGEA